MITPSYIALLMLPVVLTAWAPSPNSAQQLTQVSVRAKLTDAMLRIRFGQQAPQVEQRLAEALIAQLGRRISFVQFAAAGNGQHTLTFSLDRNDRASTSQQVDRGFWVKLTQPGQDSTEVYWFTLLPAHATSSGISSLETLIADVQSALERQDYKPVRQLLGKVPVSLEAMISAAPLGWALPFRRDVLCMLNETELRVVQLETENQVSLDRPYSAKVRGDFTRDPGPDKVRYRNGVVSEPGDPTLRASLQRAINQRLVQGVKAVYVVDYLHGGNCGLQAVPPRTDGPGGGAQ
jgi:hypothetical protein